MGICFSLKEGFKHVLLSEEPNCSVQDLESRGQENAAATAQLQNQSSGDKEQIEQLQHQLSLSTELLARDTLQFKQLGHQLASYKEQIEQLQHQLARYKEQFEQLQHESAGDKEKIKQLEALNAQFSNVCSQNDRFRSQVIKLESSMLLLSDSTSSTSHLHESFSKCAFGIVSGKNRRCEQYVRDLFDRHKNSSGGLSGESLVQALRDAHAANIPSSEQELADVMAQYDADCNGTLEFGEFQQLVNAPDELQLWLSEKHLPIAADALRPLLVGPSSDQLKAFSQLPPSDIDHAAAASCSMIPIMLQELREELENYFKIVSDMKRAPSKFNETPMACGNISDFYKGLSGRVGGPHPDFKKAMKQEHCMNACCDHQFTTTNYSITTTPQDEWMYVVGEKMCPCNQMGHGRRLVPIQDLLELPLCKNAQLTEEEVIAIVLYTGPMFQIYNTILRQFPRDTFDQFQTGNNLFPTTIFILVSAVQKLSRCTRIPLGTLLYRGLGGTKDLPDVFYHVDRNGCSGYVEWGFLSTTSNRDVALGYSGLKQGRPKAMVMVIESSSIDRGADISDLSQYSCEKEFLFLPCSFIQRARQGTRRSQLVQVIDGGLVSFVSVKININIKTQTVEELLQQKKSMHMASAKAMLAEVEFQLQGDLFWKSWNQKPENVLKRIRLSENSDDFHEITIESPDGNPSHTFLKGVAATQSSETEEEPEFVKKFRLFREIVQIHENRDFKDFSSDSESRKLANEVFFQYHEVLRSMSIGASIVSSCVNTLKEKGFGAIQSVAWHPKLPLLAIGSLGEGNLRLWNFSSGQFSNLEGHSGFLNCVNSVAFHPTEFLLATGSSDKTVKLWKVSLDQSSSTCVLSLDQKDNVKFVVFHPTAPLLAAGLSGNTVKLWRISPEPPAAICVADVKLKSSVTGVAFHPTALLDQSDRQMIYLATSENDFLNLWKILLDHDFSAATPKSVTEPEYSSKIALVTKNSYLAIHPKEPIMVTASGLGTVTLWRINVSPSLAFTETATLKHTGKNLKWVSSVAFHPSAALLVTGSNDDTVKIWEIMPDQTATCKGTLVGHTDTIVSIAFHPTEQILATGSMDNTVKLWR
jgi:WD40 repeat protein/flagellar motor protein MotB